MTTPHFSCGKLSLPLRSGGCLRRLRNSNSCLIPGGAKPPYCPVCSSSQGASEFFLCFKQLTMFSWSDSDSDRAIYVREKKKKKKKNSTLHREPSPVLSVVVWHWHRHLFIQSSVYPLSPSTYNSLISWCETYYKKKCNVLISIKYGIASWWYRRRSV